MGKNRQTWDQRQATAKKRRELRGQAVEYKGGSCRICGYDACLSAMDFHHIDAMEKDFNISNRMTSFEAIRVELDKTVLLCCRCHREVHDGLHPGYLDLDDQGPDYDEGLPDDTNDWLSIGVGGFDD